MAKIISTSAMIDRLEGLLGTKDLDDREAKFVRNIADIKRAGQVTTLTDRQVNWLSDLHERHFA